MLALIAWPASAATIRDAAMAGDRAAVRAKLDAGTPVDEENGYGLTALYYAVTRRHVETARLLLEARADPNHDSPIKGRLMAAAAEKGDPAMVRLLLDHKGNPNKGNDDGISAMHLARKPDIAELLLGHGGNPNVQTAAGTTPLTFAVARGDMAMTRFWLDHGADINLGHPDPYAHWGSTAFGTAPSLDPLETHGNPLFAAVERNDRAMIDFLLARGAKLTTTDEKGRTICPALRSAIEHDRLDLFRMLLDRGAPAADQTFLSPLFIAAGRGRAEMVHMLLARGARPGNPPEGVSPLQAAILSGKTEAVDLLLKAGADWKTARFGLRLPTALHVALAPLAGFFKLVKSKNPPSPEEMLYNEAQIHKDPDETCINMLRFLIAHGVDAQAAFRAPDNALLPMAVNSTKVTKFLLDLGAPVDLPDSMHLTALHHAAMQWTTNTQTLKLLLAHGAPVDARDNNGQTPLMEAAQNGRIPVFELLLRAGADINAVDKAGDTPLIDAIPYYSPSDQYGNRVRASGESAVRYLLDHGADVNRALTPGLTALALAAESGSTITVRLLLDHKAKVSTAERDGRTPLHRARTPEIARMLFAAGANTINARDYEGRTPLFWWIIRIPENSPADAEFVRLAAQHGADLNVRDRDGQTLVDVARSRRDPSTAKELIRLGAKPS